MIRERADRPPKPILHVRCALPGCTETFIIGGKPGARALFCSTEHTYRANALRRSARRRGERQPRFEAVPV